MPLRNVRFRLNFSRRYSQSSRIALQGPTFQLPHWTSLRPPRTQNKPSSTCVPNQVHKSKSPGGAKYHLNQSSFTSHSVVITIRFEKSSPRLIRRGQQKGLNLIFQWKRSIWGRRDLFLFHFSLLCIKFQLKDASVIWPSLRLFIFCSEKNIFRTFKVRRSISDPRDERKLGAQISPTTVAGCWPRNWSNYATMFPKTSKQLVPPGGGS